MLTRVFNWLGLGKTAGTDNAPRVRGPERSTRSAGPTPRRSEAGQETARGAKVVSPPANESSLIRNKFLREDTGTHETLKILDDSIIDSGEEEGFDPYNTGDFDRSQNWQRRFRD